jgi:crotonobetainyl-CoA:carnitine CoA-transferase CaiB-like acyl-CoA transferase
MSKPFEGIRVVDFTQVIAGPYATYQLAAQGADVIKIEQPKGGDQGRYLLAPTAHSKSVGMSAMFTAVNCGKRSLTLDLKNPAAREVVEKLVTSADVFIENFKAGTMDRLGYGYAAMREIKPDLVYCSISGFGQTGPRSDAAAYDPVVQAVSGIMSVTGHPETGPTKVGFWVTDMAAGMNGAMAISAALFRREVGGDGAYIDVSMLDTAVSLMSPLMSLFLNYGVEPPLTGNGTPGTGGSSTVYDTQEGSITVAAATDGQFAVLSRELGLPELADDPRFRLREDRSANSEAYRALVAPAFQHDTASNWEQRLAAIGVPACKNLSVAEVVVDPQVQHRQTIQTMPPPRGMQGDFSAVNLGFKVDAGGPHIPGPPPALGEHTDEVLAELGYDEEKISALRESGAI